MVWLSNKAQQRLGEAIYKEFDNEYCGFIKSPNISLICEICKEQINSYHLIELWDASNYLSFRICDKCFKKEITIIENGE